MGERFVPRRIDEGHFFAGMNNLVCANGLGDAPGLTGGNLCFFDGVEICGRLLQMD
ncbi:MAG: hypothetical protein UY00_C0055G0007 [Candidatus Wolfebacteria bacterium GW2011_GWA1_47_6]|nr:MAG: hypothetical protein UY00_C0055G0007 [Candidatus Wolfebacteria bacterium GW2011_GWA1_47_6]